MDYLGDIDSIGIFQLEDGARLRFDFITGVFLEPDFDDSDVDYAAIWKDEAFKRDQARYRVPAGLREGNWDCSLGDYVQEMNILSASV